MSKLLDLQEFPFVDATSGAAITDWKSARTSMILSLLLFLHAIWLLHYESWILSLGILVLVATFCTLLRVKLQLGETNYRLFVAAISLLVLTLAAATRLFPSSIQMSSQILILALAIPWVDTILLKVLPIESLLMKSTYFHSLPAPVCILERDRIALWNSSCEKLTRVPASKALGKTLASLGPDLLFVESEVGTDWKTNHGHGAVFRLLALDHTFLKGNLDRLDRKVLLLKDCSDSIRKQQDLQQQVKNAQKATELGRQFISQVSHELRTPVATISGTCDILSESPSLACVDRAHLETIQKSTQGLSDLLGDLVDLSKVESGQLEYRPESIDTKEFFDEILKKISPLLNSSAVELNLDYAGLVPIRFVSDPLRIQQVILNLVNNAIRATQQGSIHLQVSFQQDTQQLQIDVRDTGTGIHPANQLRIFDPFTRVELPGDGKKPRGSGIGLHLSKNLAQCLDGDLVLLESVLEQGSCFGFSLKCEAIESLETISNTKAREEETPNSKPARFPKSGLDKARILLVEDVPENRKLFCFYLETAGAITLEAANGLEALELIDTEKPDLVFMDLEMPVQGGRETIAKLREQGNRIPVIALTAHAMLGVEEELINLGFSEHLSKPCTAKQMVALAQKWLSSTAEKPSDALYFQDPEYMEQLPEAVLDMANAFKYQVPDKVDEILAKFRADEIPQSSRLIHSLKGTAGSCGLTRLHQSLVDIEMELGKGEQHPESGSRSLQMIEQLAQNARQALPSEGPCGLSNR